MGAVMVPLRDSGLDVAIEYVRSNIRARFLTGFERGPTGEYSISCHVGAKRLGDVHGIIIKTVI